MANRSRSKGKKARSLRQSPASSQQVSPDGNSSQGSVSSGEDNSPALSWSSIDVDHPGTRQTQVSSERDRAETYSETVGTEIPNETVETVKLKIQNGTSGGDCMTEASIEKDVGWPPSLLNFTSSFSEDVVRSTVDTQIDPQSDEQHSPSNLPASSTQATPTLHYSSRSGDGQPVSSHVMSPGVSPSPIPSPSLLSTSPSHIPLSTHSSPGHVLVPSTTENLTVIEPTPAAMLGPFPPPISECRPPTASMTTYEPGPVATQGTPPVPTATHGTPPVPTAITGTPPAPKATHGTPPVPTAINGTPPAPKATHSPPIATHTPSPEPVATCEAPSSTMSIHELPCSPVTLYEPLPSLTAVQGPLPLQMAGCDPTDGHCIEEKSDQYNSEYIEVIVASKHATNPFAADDKALCQELPPSLDLTLKKANTSSFIGLSDINAVTEGHGDIPNMLPPDKCRNDEAPSNNEPVTKPTETVGGAEEKESGWSEVSSSVDDLLPSLEESHCISISVLQQGKDSASDLSSQYDKISDLSSQFDKVSNLSSPFDKVSEEEESSRPVSEAKERCDASPLPGVVDLSLVEEVGPNSDNLCLLEDFYENEVSLTMLIYSVVCFTCN